MPAGITAQYAFLYQRYAFIKLALENAGMDRFFVYEGVDDVDISEENRISAVRGYNCQFVQVKSGTVSRDCWAKVIGNWLLIEDEMPSYRVILENALNFDFKADDVVSGVLDYYATGSGKASTSIANKVYKKLLGEKNETVLKERITEMLDQISFDVFSMEQLNASIEETFQSVYCPDIKKYGMAKICRCERFVECVNAEIDEAIKKKKSFTLRYVGFMDIINKVTAEISDGKYVVDIAEMRKRKKTEAEQLINSDRVEEAGISLVLIDVVLGVSMYGLTLQILYLVVSYPYKYTLVC